MSVLLAATLAGASVGLLLGALPSPGGVRLAGLRSAGLRSVGAARGHPARAVRSGWPVVALLTVVSGVVVGPVVALLSLMIGLGTTRWVASARRSGAAAAERSGATSACRVLAAELTAGRPPADALAAAAAEATGSAGEALRSAAAAARLGGDVPAALTSTAAASAVAPMLRALAACWAVCASAGGGLAAAVQRLEEGLRADQELRRTLDAELAGPRATAVLLSVLPAVGLLMAAGLGADPLRVLFGTPVGLVCLTAGLGLDALGLWWTQRLVARVRPP